jgi:hypothetical protein
MVNKNIIKQRKAMYGSNFTCIKNKWEFLFQKTISERDIALAMAEMKECRMIATKQIIEKTKDKKLLKELKASLNDTIIDMKNYEWIANNYKEYQEL